MKILREVFNFFKLRGNLSKSGNFLLSIYYPHMTDSYVNTIYYSLNEDITKYYYMLIPNDIDVEQVLSLISAEHKRDYKYIYQNGRKIDYKAKINNFYDSNGYIIVTASDQDRPPTIIIDMKKIDNSTTVDHTEKFIFRFAGGDKDMLLNGIEVELSLSMNNKQCCERLLQYIGEKIDISNKKLIIYMAGGLPFVKETLGEIYSNPYLNFQRVIYGVLADKIENYKFHEGSLKDNAFTHFIPYINSTRKGKSDLLCLFQYIRKNGENSRLFMRAIASVTRFPPLIRLLMKIVMKEILDKYDIITICTTLFTYFRSVLPSSYSNINVFEHTLPLCNIISNINSDFDFLWFRKVNIINSKGYKSSPDTYFIWEGDINEKFKKYDLEMQSEEMISDAYENYSTFTPMSLLSTRLKNSVLIIKGTTINYIYSGNYIISPLNGESNYIDSKMMFKKIINEGKSYLNTLSNIIDKEMVKQVIVVNFDESSLMLNDLLGNSINPNDDKIPIVNIAYQCLTTFASNLFGFNVLSYQALVTFNDQIKLSCPFTLYHHNFEDQCYKDIKLTNNPKLWDSIAFSLNKIIEFRKDIHLNEIYKNAISRIIVISSGKDTRSKIKVENLVKELIKNKVVVDSIILNQSKKNESIKLCAISHLTGGYCYIPENISNAISIIEQGSLLYCNMYLYHLLNPTLFK